MIRVILILFLLTSPVLADCKYYAEADVVNDVLVNKKEHYTCKEDNQNFLVTFFTDPKWEQTATMLFIAVLENL